MCLWPQTCRLLQRLFSSSQFSPLTTLSRQVPLTYLFPPSLPLAIHSRIACHLSSFPSLKHWPLYACRPIPMLFKLEQSEECSLHPPRHFLTILKLSISIHLGSDLSSSFPPHHHRYNSIIPKTKPDQPPASLQIYLFPPPNIQTTWVPQLCPVSGRVTPTPLAASFRRRVMPTLLAALFRRRVTPTPLDVRLCN